MSKNKEIRVKRNVCVKCNKDVDMESFEDKLSKEEFEIDGICQTCQNDMYKDNEDIFDIKE